MVVDGVGIRKDTHGRVPFSFLAVMMLMVTAASIPLMASVEHTGYDPAPDALANVDLGLAIDSGIGSGVPEHLDSNTIDLVNDSALEGSIRNAVHQEIAVARGISSNVGGYDEPIGDLNGTGDIDGTGDVTPIPGVEDIRVEIDRSRTSIVHSKDLNDGSIEGTAVRLMVSGVVTVVTSGPDVMRDFDWERDIPSPEYFVSDRFLASEGASISGRVMTSILTTLAQYRVLSGSPGNVEGLLTDEDIEFAAILGKTLEWSRAFRSIPEEQLATFHGEKDMGEGADLLELLQGFLDGDPFDVADVALMYLEGELRLDPREMLELTLRGLVEGTVEECFDYLRLPSTETLTGGGIISVAGDYARYLEGMLIDTSEWDTVDGFDLSPGDIDVTAAETHIAYTNGSDPFGTSEISYLLDAAEGVGRNDVLTESIDPDTGLPHMVRFDVGSEDGEEVVLTVAPRLISTDHVGVTDIEVSFTAGSFIERMDGRVQVDLVLRDVGNDTLEILDRHTLPGEGGEGAGLISLQAYLPRTTTASIGLRLTHLDTPPGGSDLWTMSGGNLRYSIGRMTVLEEVQELNLSQVDLTYNTPITDIVGEIEAVHRAGVESLDGIRESIRETIRPIIRSTLQWVIDHLVRGLPEVGDITEPFDPRDGVTTMERLQHHSSSSIQSYLGKAIEELGRDGRLGEYLADIAWASTRQVLGPLGTVGGAIITRLEESVVSFYETARTHIGTMVSSILDVLSTGGEILRDLWERFSGVLQEQLSIGGHILTSILPEQGSGSTEIDRDAVMEAITRDQMANNPLWNRRFNATVGKRIEAMHEVTETLNSSEPPDSVEATWSGPLSRWVNGFLDRVKDVVGGLSRDIDVGLGVAAGNSTISARSDGLFLFDVAGSVSYDGYGSGSGYGSDGGSRSGDTGSDGGSRGGDTGSGSGYGSDGGSGTGTDQMEGPSGGYKVRLSLGNGTSLPLLSGGLSIGEFTTRGRIHVGIVTSPSAAFETVIGIPLDITGRIVVRQEPGPHENEGTSHGTPFTTENEGPTGTKTGNVLLDEGYSDHFELSIVVKTPYGLEGVDYVPDRNLWEDIRLAGIKIYEHLVSGLSAIYDRFTGAIYSLYEQALEGVRLVGDALHSFGERLAPLIDVLNRTAHVVLMAAASAFYLVFKPVWDTYTLLSTSDRIDITDFSALGILWTVSVLDAEPLPRVSVHASRSGFSLAISLAPTLAVKGRMPFKLVINGSIEGEDHFGRFSLEPFSNTNVWFITTIGTNTDGWLLDLWVPWREGLQTVDITVSNVVGFRPFVPFYAGFLSIDFGVSFQYPKLLVKQLKDVLIAHVWDILSDLVSNPPSLDGLVDRIRASLTTLALDLVDRLSGATAVEFIFDIMWTKQPPTADENRGMGIRFGLLFTDAVWTMMEGLAWLLDGLKVFMVNMAEAAYLGKDPPPSPIERSITLSDRTARNMWLTITIIASGYTPARLKEKTGEDSDMQAVVRINTPALAGITGDMGPEWAFQFGLGSTSATQIQDAAFPGASRFTFNVTNDWLVFGQLTELKY